MDDYYTIKAWDQVFETKVSRRSTEERRYLLVPTNRQGDSYLTLMDTPHGREAYCVFIGIARIAATCPVRGCLTDEKGPWTTERLARKLAIDPRVVSRSIEMLASKEIGWLIPASGTSCAPKAHPKRTEEVPESAPEAHQESSQERTGGAPEKYPKTARIGIGNGIGIGKPPLAPPQSGGEQPGKSPGKRPTRAQRTAAKREAAQRAFDAAQAASAAQRAKLAGVSRA